MQNLFREEAVSWNVCSQLFVMDWPEKTQDIKTIVLLLEQLDWMVWGKKIARQANPTCGTCFR